MTDGAKVTTPELHQMRAAIAPVRTVRGLLGCQFAFAGFVEPVDLHLALGERAHLDAVGLVRGVVAHNLPRRPRCDQFVHGEIFATGADAEVRTEACVS